MPWSLSLLHAMGNRLGGGGEVSHLHTRSPNSPNGHSARAQTEHSHAQRKAAHTHVSLCFAYSIQACEYEFVHY